jgi:tight adherence protein C
MAIYTSILVFGAVLLFAIWLTRRRNVMQDRVRALATERRALADPDDPFSQRVLAPAMRGFTSHVLNIMPTSMVARARHWLMISNNAMSLATFMTIVLFTTVGPALLVFAATAASAGGMPGSGSLALVAACVILGFVIPMVILRRLAKNRQNQFWKALPDSLDLLSTCVEAGLSLDFAFQRVAARQRGPVGEEIERMLREKAVGQTRQEALKAMAERIDLPDVNVFVNSVIQAETLGTSIAQVLRIQSRQLRIRRRQRAEQAARQAAPKMVFPLVFFVLPSLFVVILGPIIISALEQFG